MGRLAIGLALGAALLFLAACLASPGEEAAVRAVFEEVRAGELDAVHARLAPQDRTDEARVALEAIRADIPQAEPERVRRLTTLRTVSTSGQVRLAAQHEYRYADRVLIVETTLYWPGGSAPPAILQFSVTPFEPWQAEALEFSLRGARTEHYVFFAGLVLSVALMALALLGALFTRGFKLRWLWAIAALAGWGRFVMNWNEGAWTFDPLAVGFVSASVLRGLNPLEPWIVSFQVPAGALVVLALLWPRWFGPQST